MNLDHLSPMDRTIAEITDVFAGGDGAETYIKFRWMMGGLQKKADEGDESAHQICQVVYRFHRLLELARKNG